MFSDIVGTKHRLIKGIHSERKTSIYPANIQNMVQLPNEGPLLVSNIACYWPVALTLLVLIGGSRLQTPACLMNNLEVITI